MARITFTLLAITAMVAMGSPLLNRTDFEGFNSTSNITQPSTAYVPGVLRGVNVGGWLILEKWMNGPIFEGTDATDQYSFDSTEGAKEKLKSHWEMYFVEEDVETLASWGINSLRIPIGWWAYDSTSSPYIHGADVYLERAIGWARKHGLKVLVDCHGSPGSQNGFDNSGQAGTMRWQQDDNLDKSISILQTMAKKYGSIEYADVVLGIELVNEPASWSDNNILTTQSWAQKAFHAVREASSNKDLLIVMHDAFTTPWNWTIIGDELNGNATISKAKFVIDTHLYQNQEEADSYLTQAEHISKACAWTRTNLLPTNCNLPVIVGEFSAQTNICAYPNGTTTGGNVCDVDGCQCSSNVDVTNWQPLLVQATRKFLEAQLDAFEHSARGWFIWSYKGPGAWGLDNIMKYGLLGKHVADRMFPNQCDFVETG